MTKKCKSCNEIKQLIDFYIFRRNRDGFKHVCKRCDNLRVAEWQKKNRERQNATVCRYAKRYPERVNALTMLRTARKAKATPSWLSPVHKKEIVEIYKLAKELTWLSESPLQVDHILPIKGKIVSGLHVPWNLQILPKSENCRKNNRYE